jgi:competence protein ComEA
MKNWQLMLLALFIGMLSTAVLFLVASPPRGTSIELLPAPTPAPMMVHVSGAVVQPGVYALPRDSRVVDAVQAAGGFSAQADEGAVNMAARLKDGDKLVIPAIGALPPAAGAPEQPPSGESSPGRSSSIPESTSGGLVNINTASLEELQTLPGIGATRAQDIIDYRQAHGGFTTIEDLQNVTGIGTATFERLKDLITVN